jgi:hypothetical protein
MLYGVKGTDTDKTTGPFFRSRVIQSRSNSGRPWLKLRPREQWLAVFWDVTPCSTLKVNRSFGRTCRFHLHFSVSRWFLAWLIFRPWTWRQISPPRLRSISNGLLGIMYKKIKNSWTLVPSKYTRWFRRSYRHIRTSFLTIFWAESVI